MPEPSIHFQVASRKIPHVLGCPHTPAHRPVGTLTNLHGRIEAWSHKNATAPSPKRSIPRPPNARGHEDVISVETDIKSRATARGEKDRERRASRIPHTFAI